jgi:hypothetical protein
VRQEWGCAETGKIIKEAGLPEWPSLAVFLISEASRGTASRWFPYFATLPKTPSSILQWLVIEHPGLVHINLLAYFILVKSRIDALMYLILVFENLNAFSSQHLLAGLETGPRTKLTHG